LPPLRMGEQHTNKWMKTTTLINVRERYVGSELTFDSMKSIVKLLQGQHLSLQLSRRDRGVLHQIQCGICVFVVAAVSAAVYLYFALLK